MVKDYGTANFQCTCKKEITAERMTSIPPPYKLLGHFGHSGRDRERERDGDRDRQRGRERQTDRETDRQRERETEWRRKLDNDVTDCTNIQTI